jgi:hypothetical protein
MEYSLTYSSKPPSCALIAPTHPRTVFRHWIENRQRRLGLRRARAGVPTTHLGPNGLKFGECIGLSVSFPTPTRLPDSESGCILGAHFTRASSCSLRWNWVGFYFSGKWAPPLGLVLGLCSGPGPLIWPRLCPHGVLAQVWICEWAFPFFLPYFAMGQNSLCHFLVFSSLLAHVCYVFIYALQNKWKHQNSWKSLV